MAWHSCDCSAPGAVIVTTYTKLHLSWLFPIHFAPMSSSIPITL